LKERERIKKSILWTANICRRLNDNLGVRERERSTTVLCVLGGLSSKRDVIGLKSWILLEYELREREKCLNNLWTSFCVGKKFSSAKLLSND
jgi:hypothetical protein